jgi:hypothetical protein
LKEEKEAVAALDKAVKDAKKAWEESGLEWESDP